MSACRREKNRKYRPCQFKRSRVYKDSTDIRFVELRKMQIGISIPDQEKRIVHYEKNRRKIKRKVDG